VPCINPLVCSALKQCSKCIGKINLVVEAKPDNEVSPYC